MKGKASFFFVLLLLGFSSFLSGISITSALEDNNILNPISLNSNGDEAFDHIYGSPGHVGLAIDEEENLIFTNAYEGIAFIPRDDLSNQTVYAEEIGLSDLTVEKLAIDKELKLLYIGYLGGVDVLNYSQKPLLAQPVIESFPTNYELTDFIEVDPVTHFVWIVSKIFGLYVYDPINDREVDVSGYDIPSDSVEMVTVDVNSTINRVFIGTEQGMYMINTLTNATSQLFTTSDGLPYNYVKVIKSYPEINKTFMSTFHVNTSKCGGLSVLFLNNNTIKNYNWTGLTYDPRVIFDIVCDPVRELGYIASPYSPNAEFGLLIFNTTDMSGIAKSQVGSLPSFGPPQVAGSPDSIEGVLGAVELDTETREIFVGSVIRIQKIDFQLPLTATTANSPLLGLQQNSASDVNYDPVDEKFYVSTLLGLDRVDANTQLIEHLIMGVGGSGGDTSGELLESARLFYHNRERYDITAGTWIFMDTIIPEINEYNYVKDIEASQNESVLYYCTAEETNGVTGNGSLIIYNRDTSFYKIEDFGYNISELHVTRALEDPNRDVLYVATNQHLILYNLTTLSEIKRFGGGLWDIKSMEWINGLLWFGLEQYPNVRIFNPITETFSNFGLSSQILYPAINDIYYIEDKNEIYILAHSGLYVYNYSSGQMKYESEAEGLSTLILKRMDYSPLLEEVWIGSAQGVNIYDRTFDNVAPFITTDILESQVLTGFNKINISATDYSGIKEIKATVKNTTYSFTLVTPGASLQVDLDTLDYTNGDYQFEINATDWNDVVNNTVINFQINNIIVNEFSKAILLLAIPSIAVIIFLISKKKTKA